MMQWIAHGLPAGDLPEPRGPVLAAGQRQRTRGVQGHGQHLTLVSQRTAAGLARARVPESSRAVVAAGHGDFPVAAQGHRPDVFIMTQRVAERPAVGRVPDLGTVLSPRHQRPGGQDPLSVGGAGEPPNSPVVQAPGWYGIGSPITRPVRRSQRRTVLSPWPAVMATFPSGRKTTC